MTEEETEEIEISCTWQTTHRVEVPKGWRPTGTLSDFPPDVLEQLDARTAELVDWE